MEDTRFDALLRTAAADAARDDLQTANLQRAPRRARKPLRVFIAAAACVALLTTGVAAAWSQIRMTRSGSMLSFQVEGNTRQTQSDAISQKMEFGYLPSIYTVEWDESAEQAGYYFATISYQGTEKLFVYQLPLNSTIGHGVTPGNAEEDLGAQLDLIESNTLVLDSIASLSPEQLDHTGSILWVGDDCYYTVLIGDPSMKTETIVRILQNITP